MSVNKAISNILDKNLDEMRVNFSSALSEKAVMKLDEKKAKIGKGYFGQVMEDNVGYTVGGDDDPDEISARQLEKKAAQVSNAAGATGIKSSGGTISQSVSGNFKNGVLTKSSGSPQSSTTKLKPVDSFNNSSGIDSF